MAIIVLCQKCHSRFKVSEKFAGRKGACPKCKGPIVIPKEDEQVTIHTPEQQEGGARGRGGELVLKPISRKDLKASWVVIAVMIAGALVPVIAAVLLRGAEEAMKQWLGGIGAILLAPPLIIASYTFLRDDELEPYRGLALLIRTAICSAIYAGCWGAYHFVPPEWTDEVYKWAFLGPVFGAAGATAAFACFDLDFTSGFFHFAFYIGATVLLAYMMGLPLI